MARCDLTAHGSSMRTCAEDLIKFGTNISTTETILGEGERFVDPVFIRVDGRVVLC